MRRGQSFFCRGKRCDGALFEEEVNDNSRKV